MSLITEKEFLIKDINLIKVDDDKKENKKSNSLINSLFYFSAGTTAGISGYFIKNGLEK